MSNELDKLRTLIVNTGVEGDSETLSPVDYFNTLKSKVEETNKESLDKQLKVVISKIQKADEVGQNKFVKELLFSWKVLLKELTLTELDIKKYVYKDDLKDFVDKVTPKNSIKVIELERYPRSIPDDVISKIKKIKDKNIFDDFCVVFTDLTGKDYKTEEEKAFVQANRDPIVFGYFTDKEASSLLNHDRFYMIADWEDEFCDLTFTKMIETMSEIGIDPEKATGDLCVEEDIDKYLTKMVSKYEDKQENKDTNFSFFQRLKNKIIQLL